jgi:hypothetical protein
MKQSKLFALAAALAAVFVMAGGALAQTDPPPPPPPPQPDYTITGSGTSFTVTTTNGGGGTVLANKSIQEVIDAIRDHSYGDATLANTPINIQFGTFGTDGVLDIGTATASFRNGSFAPGGNSTWRRIILWGKITSAMGLSGVGSGGTILIGSGVSVQSLADIANNGIMGNAIDINGGKLEICGGRVERVGDGGCAVYSSDIEGGQGGTLILSGSPTIIGNIQVLKEALSVKQFNPAEKQYRLTIYGSAGDVAVVGGANFISNFTLVNSGNFTLKISGNDLVLYDPATSIITKNTVSAKPSGISVNGTGLRIVGAASSTPVRIYDMRGKLWMSRSAMPNEAISVSNLARGTYVVKALGNSVKIVR